MISICKYCNSEFKTWPSKVGNYCSVPCTRKGTGEARGNKKVVTSCKHCNKEFMAYMWHLNRGQSRYCSRKCRMLSDNPLQKPEAREKARIARAKNPSRYWLGKKRNMPWFVPKKGAPAPMKNRPNLKIRGDKHWNWKGGISPRPMSSLEYKQWRKLVFEKDDYTCQLCTVRGGYLEADHIKRWADFPELRFDVNNGRALCKSCHKNVTFGRKTYV